MNRRQFLMGSAAALVAAPAVAADGKWFIGFDAANATDRCSAMMVWRLNYENQIYIEDFSTDALIDDCLRRWRTAHPKIVEVWTSVGR